MEGVFIVISVMVVPFISYFIGYYKGLKDIIMCSFEHSEEFESISTKYKEIHGVKNDYNSKK